MHLQEQHVRISHAAWVMVAVALMVVMGWMAYATRTQSFSVGFTFANAKLSRLSDAGLVSGATSDVQLPHVWNGKEGPAEGSFRYTLPWPNDLTVFTPRADARDSGWALLVARAGANFRVLLDGRPIYSAHWADPLYADTSTVPHEVVLPFDTNMQQPHLLQIDVQGRALRQSGVGLVTLAPAMQVHERFNAIAWWQVYLTWMVAACSGMLALLTGMIWWSGREKIFAWLSIASLAWAVRLMLTPSVQPPMGLGAWFFLHKYTFITYCCFLYLFLHDFFDFRQMIMRRVVWLVIAVSPIWIFAILMTGEYDGYRLLTGLLVLIALVSVGSTLFYSRAGVTHAHRLLLVVSVVTLITGLRDFLAVQFGLFGEADLRWMIPGSLVFLLTLGHILVQRQARFMEQIQRLNADLVIKVNAKEHELTQAFEKIKEAEAQRVLVGERARLTRDMHDGLGSQLVQTLNAVRSGVQLPMSQIEEMLSHALEELRMTLDSMEPVEGDLPTMLGTLRGRIQSALKSSGIELDWAVDDVPSLVDAKGRVLEAKGVMQLFRCVQEVFANVVKHARARKVSVRTALSPQGVLLSICDDGRGMLQMVRAGGRGMENIRLRADSIGARVQWNSSDSGTEVLFTFRYQGQPT
jgi:signal transduction histidine kinase